MVFMTVRDNDTSYPLFSFRYVAEIRNYQVDAQHFFLGEH